MRGKSATRTVRAIAPRAAMLVTAALISAATAFVVVALTDDGETAAATKPAAASTRGGDVAASTSGLSVQEIYRRVRAGVVEITVRGGDEPRPPFAPRGERRGQGSGFVIDRDGRIVSNFRVVRDAERVAVPLSDGK